LAPRILVLEVTRLEVRHGSVTAVKGISLEVAEGEVVAIIRPNGAGKTSTLRAITGLVPAAGGRVVFRGTDVSRWKAHRIVTLGLGHAPEGRRLFPQMTVMENLRMDEARNPRATWSPLNTRAGSRIAP
jgi:branched-chain amino acid transport system ATP-binding protein